MKTWFEVFFDTHVCEVSFIFIIKQSLAEASYWYNICKKIIRMNILNICRPKALLEEMDAL